MTSPINITLYFDYLCPYAYRGVKLLTEIEQIRPEVSINWRLFSLEQNNAIERGKDANWKIWEQPLDYPTLWRRPRSRMLPALLATHAAQLQGKEAFARFRLAVYKAYHDEKLDTSEPDTLLEIARNAGLNLDKFQAGRQSEAARLRLRDDWLIAQKEGVFGVPTLVINGCEATYLRLTELPENAQDRQVLFDELVHLLTTRPYLLELKRAGAL